MALQDAAFQALYAHCCSNHKRDIRLHAVATSSNVLELRGLGLSGLLSSLLVLSELHRREFRSVVRDALLIQPPADCP